MSGGQRHQSAELPYAGSARCVHKKRDWSSYKDFLRFLRSKRPVCCRPDVRSQPAQLAAESSSAARYRKLTETAQVTRHVPLPLIQCGRAGSVSSWCGILKGSAGRRHWLCATIRACGEAFQTPAFRSSIWSSLRTNSSRKIASDTFG